MKALKFNGSEIITGPGSIDKLKEIQAERIFVVTGKGSMFKNGTIGRIEEMFESSGKTWEILSGIGGNPTRTEVEAGTEKMKAFGPDAVVAVGGGSAIDAAKVMTLLCDCPSLTIDEIKGGHAPSRRERIQLPDAVVAVGGGSAIDAAKVMTLLCDCPSLTIDEIKGGHAPSRRERIQLIAVPSTSGTASEVTRAAVVTFEEEKIKVGLKTTAFIPDIAILDGELTLSMPKHVMVETGMDALTHALESYINKNNDDFCKMISKGAVEGLCRWLPESFEKADIESRQHVHNYQCYAGMAFQNSGLGMDHGIAHAFGGRFGTSHGLLNAVALPYVLKYNARDPEVKADLDELSRVIGEEIIGKVEALNEQFGVPVSFKDMGISEEDFETYYDSLLDNSMKGSTVRNPVKMTVEAMDLVLKSIYRGEILF